MSTIMQIAEIMTRRVVTVEMDDRISIAKDIFQHVEFHHLLVLDEQGELVGVLSERDLLRAISPHLGSQSETERDRDTLNKRVHQIMTRNPRTIAPETSINLAAQLMVTHGVGSLPVLEQGKIVGIVTWKDLLQAYSN